MSIMLRARAPRKLAIAFASIAIGLGAACGAPADSREQKRDEPAAERKQDKRSADALVCNDGTLSPSCTCNGPRTGCCSGHGGVRGCQQ